MKSRHFIIFITLLFCSPAFPQPSESNLCKKELKKAIYLENVEKSAAKAKKAICSSESQIQMNLAYINFLDEISGWFEPYGGFLDGKSVIEEIKGKITIANPSIAVSLSISDKIQVAYGASFKPNDESKCKKISNADRCVDVLEEFIQLHAEVQNLQAEPDRLATLRELQLLQAEWKPFLEQMKGQTWLELLINRQAYKNSHNSFASPPSSQWIVLHPTMLIENVSAAADGENTQEALGLEVIGKNWWKQEKWYIPSGASALAVYSDRTGVKDVGYGVALHFLSNYTLGYTNHHGENGLFVSIDIIKLFQDKKKAFHSYKKSFNE